MARGARRLQERPGRASLRSCGSDTARVTDPALPPPAPPPARPTRGVNLPLSAQLALARTLFALSARLPFRLAYALGGPLGALGYLLPTRTRRLTRVNLTLCFPELSARDRARLGRRSSGEAARFVLELGRLWSRPREQTLALVREVHGLEHAEAAFRAGRGVIAITPHMGSWELAGLWASSHWPITSLYKPPRLRALEAFLLERRQRFGARLVPAGPSGVGAIVRALRDNELVAVLPDQDPGRGSGRFAPFFGVPASTSVLIPRLIARTGAAAVLAACVRLPRAGGFAMHIAPASPALADPDLDVATAALNLDIERFVRRFVEQYLWSYPRFRRSPPGVPSRYGSGRG